VSRPRSTLSSNAVATATLLTLYACTTSSGLSCTAGVSVPPALATEMAEFQVPPARADFAWYTRRTEAGACRGEVAAAAGASSVPVCSAHAVVPAAASAPAVATVPRPSAVRRFIHPPGRSVASPTIDASTTPTGCPGYLDQVRPLWTDCGPGVLPSIEAVPVEHAAQHQQGSAGDRGQAQEGTPAGEAGPREEVVVLCRGGDGYPVAVGPQCDRAAGRCSGRRR